jgi:exopolysaccharide production protein ExoQ
MPAQIALSLCLIFILYVFWLDYKRTPESSNALWVPLIWTLIVGSRPASQWLKFGSAHYSTIAGVEQGSPIDRLIYSALILFSIVILSKRIAALSKILTNNKWIVLWFLYCGISIAWSDYPFVAFKRLINGIGTALMALVVMTELNPVESLKTLVRRCAYVLIPLSILLIKYYRDLGIVFNEWTGEEMVTGVTGNKNLLGALCLFTGFLFFYDVVTSWHHKNEPVNNKKKLVINILLLCMIVLLLIKSNSATSLVTFLIGCSIFIAFGFPIIKKNIKNVGILIFIFCIVLFILEQTFNLSETIIVEHLGRNMTFTERSFLWSALLDTGTNPIIGTGYGSFWVGKRLELIWSKFIWQPNEAHNGYLEIYLELGLLGLALLSGMIMNTYRKVRRSFIYEFDYARLRMGLLAAVLLHNITEASFNRVSLMWFIFLIISIDIDFKSITKNANVVSK